MTGAELAPLELAGRLALALGLTVFLGLAFEEVYKREERSTPGGVRTFPILALCGAMLYLIEPRQALAFIVGLIALAIWLHAFLRNALPSPNTTSLMIPASNLLAYLIGPIALTQPPWLVVAVSVTAVVLLGTREQLHRLTSVVPQNELLTAGKFLIPVMSERLGSHSTLRQANARSWRDARSAPGRSLPLQSSDARVARPQRRPTYRSSA